MRVMSNNDFRTFEQLCALSQSALKKTLSTYIRTKYKTVVETEDYIYAEGTIPIALCAHMDTVFKTPATEVYYDRQKNVIFSPMGLGADDRAGVYAILQIIKRGLRPHIIFTTDEEIGARGAIALSHEDCPFENLRYIIQLDRRGANDCVFYDCDNPEFVRYVETFGFVEAFGSFSDISMICPAWKVAGVNLSVGYRDEHSVSEVLFVGHLLNTIDKTINMLQDDDTTKFEYIPCKYNSWYKYVYGNKEDKVEETCPGCNKKFDATELIPVKQGDFTFKYYCIDCVATEKIQWCRCCGEAYVKPKKDRGLCEDCLYDFGYNQR